MSLTRRSFLIRTGVVSGGLVALSSCGLMPALPTFAAPAREDALTWVQLKQDGSVKFYCPRSEMGQGIASSFTLLVAQELALPVTDIEFSYPNTTQIPPAKMTVGSESVQNFARPLALAAATLREALRHKAAEQLGVEPNAVEIHDGVCRVGDTSLTYREIMAEQALEVLTVGEAEVDLVLFSAQASNTETRPAHQFDRDIVTGKEQYSRDTFAAGLVFGAVARAPWLGASMLGSNPSAAKSVPGVIKVIDGPNGEPGVIAETPMSAKAGIAALDVRWQVLRDAERQRIDEINDVDQLIDSGGFEHTPLNVGDIAAAKGKAAQEVNVRYDSPLTAHASMEPRAGVAHVKDGHCYVDTGSQDPWYVQAAVAKATGLPREKVIVQNHRLGGGFGGRIHCQASVEAAWLAMQTDRPVKVQWSREEEFTRNYVGPGFSHRIEAGVSDDGTIRYWHHRMVGSPILTSSALIPSNLHWAADFVPDPGTWRGAETSYQINDHLVEFSDIRRPVPTGAWRGLGAAPNTFAVECAIDELAEAAAIDPIDLRVKNAKSPRLRLVLERLRASLPDTTDRYFGIAAGAYKGVTFVAVAAEVNAMGKLVGLWCAHDCGRMISADRVSAQVESCLVWGIGMALSEKYVVENGIGVTNNFHKYTVPRISDVPPIHIELVDSTEDATGAGEAAFPPTTAAIVNAMAKIKPRQRSLPLS